MLPSDPNSQNSISEFSQKGNKWVKWLVLLVVVLLVVVGWFAVRAYLPINPVTPYFPNTDNRLGGVQWYLGEFQPIYLFSFTSKDNYFIKVAYRNANQKITLMDVLVGRNGADSIFFSNVVLQDGIGTVKIGNIGEYGKYFKTGDRIHITYLRNVLKRPGDQLDIVEPNAENTKEVCNASKVLCYSLSLVQANAKEFWDFPVAKSFPNNLFFPGIWLSDKLIH